MGKSNLSQSETTQSFKALMASDNFDHGHGLADSEIRCIREMRTAIRTLPLGEASSQFAAVSAQIQRLAGQRWGTKDLEAFWKATLRSVGIIVCIAMTKSARVYSTRLLIVGWRQVSHCEDC